MRGKKESASINRGVSCKIASRQPAWRILRENFKTKKGSSRLSTGVHIPRRTTDQRLKGTRQERGPLANSGEMVIEKEDAVPICSKKRHRKAGEISGRQLALKKLEKEGSREWNCPFPPPFLPTVTTMRKCLIEFNDENEAASAMRIYTSRRLGIDTRVSSHLFYCTSLILSLST